MSVPSAPLNDAVDAIGELFRKWLWAPPTRAQAEELRDAVREAIDMPTVVIQVADGGVISETEWQALGERLKAIWREQHTEGSTP
jgi:hypothetical protein